MGTASCTRWWSTSRDLGPRCDCLCKAWDSIAPRSLKAFNCHSLQDKWWMPSASSWKRTGRSSMRSGQESTPRLWWSRQMLPTLVHRPYTLPLGIACSGLAALTWRIQSEVWWADRNMCCTTRRSYKHRIWGLHIGRKMQIWSWVASYLHSEAQGSCMIDLSWRIGIGARPPQATLTTQNCHSFVWEWWLHSGFLHRRSRGKRWSAHYSELPCSLEWGELPTRLKRRKDWPTSRLSSDVL